jgi:hypothetical protein
MASIHPLIEKIQRTGFQFFQDFTNFKSEKGYGLTVDHTGNLDLASIASTGFALSSYVIGVKHGYITRQEALMKVIGTLKTLQDHVPNYHGFFAHFLNIHTAERSRKCEYSTIDTALALNGVITVAGFFLESEVQFLAQSILNRVDWDHLIHLYRGKKRLYMAYNPDADGDYVNGKPGFIHHWSMFAEQLMMYVMYASTHSKSDAIELYESFERQRVQYEDASYLSSPGNALFVYQYPLAWLHLNNVTDHQGISWFNNAQQAVLGHYRLSRAIAKDYPTFGKHYFGLTASYGIQGYQVCEALPNVNHRLHTDGSVAPNAMIGSLPFQSDLSIQAIQQLSLEPNMWDERYGFKNAFNNLPTRWIAERYLGIDKGLEMLMANAYLYQDVYQAYHAHPLIVRGMETLQWKKR